MIEATLRRLIQSDSKRFKGVKGGAMAEARKVATKAFEAIEKSYRPSTIEEPEPYKVAV
jgi:hypothetical protein